MERLRASYRIVLLLMGLIVFISMAGAFLLLPASGHLRAHLWKVVLVPAAYTLILYTITRRPAARRLRYLISTSAVLTVALLCYDFCEDLPAIFLLYLFPIATAVLFWDTATAIFTAALSTLSHAAVMALVVPMTANLAWDISLEGIAFFLIAILAGVGVEKWRLRTEQLSVLNAIAQTLSQSLDLDTVLSAALDKVLETLEFESGAIYVKDIETGELEMKQHHGLSEEFRRAVAKGIISARVAESGKPFVIDDLLQDPNAPRVVVEEGYRPLASIPLLSKEQVQGVLTIASRQLRRFRQQDVDLLLSIGNQIGVAIENARLYEHSKKRLNELSGLYEISQAFSSMIDVRETFSELTKRIAQLIGCQKCVIARYDHQAREMRAEPPGYGLSDELVRSFHYKVDGPAREAWNFRLQGPLLANDVTQIADFFSQWVQSFGLFNLLIVPLSIEGRITGLVYAANKPGGFTQGDTRLLIMFANQAAIAIENARLFEAEQRKRQEAETLRQAAQALSATLDLQEVFESILSELQRVVPYDSASVQLLKGDRLEIIGGHGFPNLDELLGISFPVDGDNPNRQVMATRAPFIVEDAPAVYSGFREEPHAQAGIRAWLGVPLLFGDRLIGMIALDKRVPGFYTEEHAHLAQAFAAQAAIAIENARLYEEEQRRVSQLRLMREVGQRIASILDLDQLLNKVVSSIKEAFGYHYVAVFLVDAHTKEIVLSAQDGPLVQSAKTRLKIGKEGITGWVAQSGEPLLVNDVHQEPRYYFVKELKETRSELAVPIRTAERVIGVLDVQSTELGGFDESDLDTLQTLADQLAVAIENARLYEEVQRRSAQRRTIAEVGRRVAAILEMDALLSQVVDLIAQNFGYYYVHIFQIDPDSEYAVYKAGTRKAGLAIAEEGLRLKVGEEGIIGWVAQYGQPLLVNDVGQEPRYYPHPALPDTRSELAVPIHVGGRIIGVLDVQSTELDAFDESDLDTLETLADQLAVAMENARLYEETQRLAITDGLTGLYNLRYFYEALEKEIQRSERYHRSVSLIILDIDDFKAYNDLYGHLAGDDLLIELAQLMSKVTRQTDTLARYGGEEFAIILPETETEAARFLAERLQEEVREHRFQIQNGQTIGRITISLGVATYPHHADSAKALVGAADKALLRAKQAGKNRLVVCGEELTELKLR